MHYKRFCLQRIIIAVKPRRIFGRRKHKKPKRRRNEKDDKCRDIEMGIGEMQHPFPEARHFFRRKSFTSGHKVDFLSKKFLRADNGDERHTRKDGSEYGQKCISKKGGGRAAVKLFFTTVYSSTSAPKFACGKLV